MAIALYAALLSTGVALAHLVRWHLSRQSLLEVEVCASIEPTIVWIDVINRGEQDEQIVWVYVEQRDTEGVWDRGYGYTGDACLRPGHRQQYTFAEPDVMKEENADSDIEKLTRPYRVSVINGIGEEFFSSIHRPRK